MVAGHTEDHRLLWPYDNNDGRFKETPFNIFALVLARTVGDFIEQCLFASTLKQQFQYANLFIYWRNDRPYKKHVVSMMPNLTQSWSVQGENSLPMDSFDNAGQRPLRVQSQPWYDMGCDAPDLVLTPKMMQCTMLPSFPSLARFSMAPEQQDRLGARLVERGVDPNRWFCVLHYREPNYGFRKKNLERDFDPDQAIAVTRHVTQSLGGQVVRIGHPGMAPFPNIPGFIDLSSEEDGFQLHAHAVSRSRFFLELSSSGPISLALLFGVPVARCNCVGVWGPVEAHSLVLPKHIRRPDGRLMSPAEMMEERVIHDTVMSRLLEEQGYSFVPNSLEELKAVAKDMVATTSDCPGWRVPSIPAPTTPANKFQWPLPHSMKHKIASYPELAGSVE